MTRLQQQAQSYATQVLETLDYVGVLAIEFFYDGQRLLANEMAPRVHNSGHWTIEGAQTSQFENHLRAVFNLPLGGTEALGQVFMLNCVGEMPDIQSCLSIPGAHYHTYGKTPRPNRKLGHVTLVDLNLDPDKFQYLKSLSSNNLDRDLRPLNYFNLHIQRLDPILNVFFLFLINA